MYHSFKKKDIKAPKGWLFFGKSGDGVICLKKSNCNHYFKIINERIEAFVNYGKGLTPDKKPNQWRIEEHSTDLGIPPRSIERDLTETECKEIAIKLANKYNRSELSSKFIWLLVGALVATLIGMLK